MESRHDPTSAPPILRGTSSSTSSTLCASRLDHFFYHHQCDCYLICLSLSISIALSSQSIHLHPFSPHGPYSDAHLFCAPPLHAGGPGFRYASLYFCCCVEPDDNELLTLEVIHRYVELLDKYFGSVSPSISKSTIITLLISWRSNSLLYLDSYSNIQMVIWEKLFTEILHNMKMFDPKEL